MIAPATIALSRLAVKLLEGCISLSSPWYPKRYPCGMLSSFLSCEIRRATRVGRRFHHVKPPHDERLSAVFNIGDHMIASHAAAHILRVIELFNLNRNSDHFGHPSPPDGVVEHPFRRQYGGPFAAETRHELALEQPADRSAGPKCRRMGLERPPTSIIRAGDQKSSRCRASHESTHHGAHTRLLAIEIMNAIRGCSITLCTGHSAHVSTSLLRHPCRRCNATWLASQTRPDIRCSLVNIDVAR